MQFVMTAEHVYPWPVKVTLPNPEKAGAVVVQEFVGTFRLMDEDEAIQLSGQLRAARDGKAHVEASKDQIRRVLVGWEGIRDQANKPVPFSADALEALLRQSHFRTAAIEAYAESISGKAAEGN